MLLLAAPFVYGLFRGIQELRIALTETEPTQFTAADFAERHQGEQWVQVRGRAAVEHCHVQPSFDKAHKGKDLIYVYVPVVPETWDPSQPITIAATFGPMPNRRFADWKEGMGKGPHTVQGQLRPGGVRDPQSWFPGLRIGPSLVFINEGTEPKGVGGMVFFILLMAAACGMIAFGLSSTGKQYWVWHVNTKRN
jgi:hypothetical protein